MNEDKLIELLNSLDDDLIEKEVDTLLEGIEIDMDSIKEKAMQKLEGNSKKMKNKKKYPIIVAACVCALSISTVYADDISEAIKSFFNVRTVYSTTIDGKAYYLKEELTLDEHIKLKSVQVSEGKLEVKLSSGLSERKLGDLKIIPKDSTDTIYTVGGYSEENGQYFYSFMNEKKENYDIKPFKDFKLTVAGKDFDVSLDEAKSIVEEGSKIYIPTADETNGIKGVSVGARIIEGKEKLNIQLITSFDDKGLKLSRLGKPGQGKITYHMENRGSEGITLSGGSGTIEDIYVYDSANNKYRLEVPKNFEGTPVTIFETNAPKDEKLTIKLPALVATLPKITDTFSLTIPKDGETVLDKTIDLGAQKAVLKSIKRTSPTTAEAEFDLNTGDNRKVSVESFDIYSKQVKKINWEFEGNKAHVTFEFDQALSNTDIEISYPKFIMNGNWSIALK